MLELCFNPLVLIVLIVLLMVYVFGIKETKDAFIARFNDLKNKFKKVKAELKEEDEVEIAKEDEVETMMPYASVTEPFNNDLLKPDTEIDADDYERTLKTMVLEPEVYDQHKKFTEELMHRVGGTSSRSPVRDDNVDVVPWVGLKRPAYQKINPNDGTARTVPTVMDADDLADYQQIMWKPSSSML